MMNTQHRALEPRDSGKNLERTGLSCWECLALKASYVCFSVFLALALGKSKGINQSSSISMIGSPIQRNGFWETRHRRNGYNRMEVVVSAGISCHRLKQKTLWFHKCRGLWTVVFRHPLRSCGEAAFTADLAYPTFPGWIRGGLPGRRWPWKGMFLPLS